MATTAYPRVYSPPCHSKNFIMFDCSSPKDEPEKRFQHFTTQVSSHLATRAELWLTVCVLGSACCAEVRGAEREHGHLHTFVV